MKSVRVGRKTEQEQEETDTQAGGTGAPVAELIRRAIDAYTKEKRA